MHDLLFSLAMWFSGYIIGRLWSYFRAKRIIP